jgi:hypothetical protein
MTKYEAVCSVIVRKEDGGKWMYCPVDSRGWVLPVCLFVCLMVFNATFNNISVISWLSVLLVKETGFESRSGRGVQHYVIKFVSDLRQVSGLLWVLRFPSPIKLTATI